MYKLHRLPKIFIAIIFGVNFQYLITLLTATFIKYINVSMGMIYVYHICTSIKADKNYMKLKLKKYTELAFVD